MILTTSFPVDERKISGPFIFRLVESLPGWILPMVITPGAVGHNSSFSQTPLHVHCFRYAPRRWQVLAHRPGGIPVALRENRNLLLLLPGFLASMFFSCLRFSKNADLIHAQWSVCGIIAAAVARIRKLPVVTTLRGEDVTRARNRLVYRWMLQFCMRWSRCVVTVSYAIGQEIRESYPRWAARVVTIPNGVDRAFLRIPKPQRWERTNIRFGVVGSLIPRKDVRTAIEAFNRLNSDSAELEIIGEGPEGSDLKRLVASLGLNDRIHFAGHVSPHEIPDHLSRMDVMVLCSRSEGRPNVVLEAMAAALPVLATDIDGVREIVLPGNNGFLFDPGDVQHLSTCMRYLLEHPEDRDAMGQASRQRILDQGLFWDATASKYVEIYEQAIRSP